IGADTATYPAVRVSGGGVGIPPAPPITPPRGGAAGVPSPGTTARSDAYEPIVVDGRRRGPGLLLGVLALVLIAVVSIWVWMRSGDPAPLRDGITAFTQGNRVAARRDFEQAAVDRPKRALPHVYLARMARQDGD